METFVSLATRTVLSTVDLAGAFLSGDPGSHDVHTVLVALVTRTVRGIPSEVPLDRSDGLMTECVASIDNTQVIPKASLTRKLGALADGRWHEVCAATRAAIDC